MWYWNIDIVYKNYGRGRQAIIETRVKILKRGRYLPVKNRAITE